MSKYTAAYLEIAFGKRNAIAAARYHTADRDYYLGKASGLGLAGAFVYSLLSTEDRGIIDVEIAKHNKEDQEIESALAAGTPPSAPQVRWDEEPRAMARILLSESYASVTQDLEPQAPACCPATSGDDHGEATDAT